MVSFKPHIARVARLLPKSIAARLYGSAGLALVTIILLASGAVFYVQRTERVVTGIKEHEVDFAAVSADIELLLERHRRIVETAPIQLDRIAVERGRRLAADIADRIKLLAIEAPDHQLAVISSNHSAFAGSAHRVMSLSANFAQDEALEAVQVYTEIASKMQSAAHQQREASLQAAGRHVADLLARGQALKNWIIAAALTALFIAGPLSLLIIRSVVTRIKGITDGMRRIAVNDTAVPVPSIRDHDEIGDMTRALEVFKQNAVTLLGNAKEIEKLNHWFDIALNNMARGLSMFDAERRLIVCNRRYLELYGLPEQLAVPGTRLADIAQYWRCALGARDEDQDAASAWFATLDQMLERGQRFTETHHLADGRTILVHVEPLDEGGWVDVHEDVTERHQADAQITQLARFDTLTGLANRHHFLSGLEDALGINAGRLIAEKNNAESGRFAVLWLDLDKFKEVNDTLGHPAGDALLQAAAERLRGTIRANDIVARLGGDEFAILVNGSAVGEAETSGLARRIIAALAAPFSVGGQTVTIGVSIGIALSPQHGATADDLMRNADIALYRAKTGGRGTFVFYSSEFEQKIRARRQLEIDLRRAVEAGELTLFYQPILDLGLRKVSSCEALMRWNHPERGMISPAEFIALAEEIGLIGRMGEWALKQACSDAVSWPQHIKVAVNLSANQFSTSDLVAATSSALAASGLLASRLELEVTESLLLQDNVSTLATLRALRDLGVSIALDDFGTGYASLSYLRSFPFDKIKIDQSFVRDLPSRGDCVAIVRAVVDLAKTLGMRSVAEGIETMEHLDQVAAAGCDEAQGYYFSRPVPAASIAEAIAGCGVRLDRAA